MPARLAKTIRIMGADYMSDPQLTSEVSSTLVGQCMQQRRMEWRGGDDDALMGSMCAINPGELMERIISVDAGDQVLWNFKVGRSSEASSRILRRAAAKLCQNEPLQF